MKGYLRLHLSKFNNTHKKLDKIKVNSNKLYAMSGSYITSFASSLIKNEHVSGMMLDITWKLLQKYVVSIPTLIICNIDVPIGFSFFIVEDTFLYKDFLDTFQNSY